MPSNHFAGSMANAAHTLSLSPPLSAQVFLYNASTSGATVLPSLVSVPDKPAFFLLQFRLRRCKRKKQACQEQKPRKEALLP